VIAKHHEHDVKQHTSINDTMRKTFILSIQHKSFESDYSFIYLKWLKNSVKIYKPIHSSTFKFLKRMSILSFEKKISIITKD